MNLYNKEIISQSLYSSVTHTQTRTIKMKKRKLQQKLSWRVDVQIEEQ